MSAIVVEEKIYNSMKNTRLELINIRKAVPSTSYINTTSILASKQSYTVSACTFFHIHSSCPVQVYIKKSGQVLDLITSLITLEGQIDQAIITNTRDSNNEIYITYAC